jgi:rubredoxin
MEEEIRENEDVDFLDIEDDDLEDTVQVCPVCGSIDLYYEAGGVEGLYHCKHCGYIGSFIVEANEEMARLIRKEYDNKERNTAL